MVLYWLIGGVTIGVSGLVILSVPSPRGSIWQLIGSLVLILALICIAVGVYGMMNGG